MLNMTLIYKYDQYYTLNITKNISKAKSRVEAKKAELEHHAHVILRLGYSPCPRHTKTEIFTIKKKN